MAASMSPPLLNKMTSRLPMSRFLKHVSLLKTLPSLKQPDTETLKTNWARLAATAAKVASQRIIMTPSRTMMATT